MNQLAMDQKGLFTFTGNPFIDNGMAVLALIAKKDQFNEITPHDIANNLESFFEPIKHQYDDPLASKDEKKYVKKKLKQHLLTLAITNHYLYGINNWLCHAYEVIITSSDCPSLLNKLPQVIDHFQIENAEIDKKKLTFQLRTKDFKKEISSEYIKNLLIKKLGDQSLNIKIKAIEKKLVDTNEEFYNSLSDEAINSLKGISKKLGEPGIRETSNLCNFCGKDSEILLYKDLFPLTAGLGILNLGKVHICRFCYVASLFAFISALNFRKENSTGLYYFYHFGEPKAMIEHARIQYNYLKNPTNLGSLQSVIGNKYDVVFEDLYKRTSILKPASPLTIYFLLNHNQDMKVIYNYITIPNGLLSFWMKLNSPDLSSEWNLLFHRIKDIKAYEQFINGDITNIKYLFVKNKKIVVIEYLKEVVKMKDNTISICENLAEMLREYFLMVHEKNPKRRDHWAEEFHDYFKLTKPHEFFNSLLEMNNEYFRWTGGKNLVSVSSVKTLLAESIQYSLLYNLIEYFILNNLTEEEKKFYFEFENKRKNVGEKV